MAPPVVNYGSCAACLQPIQTRLFLKCCLCSKLYDIECVNVGEKRFHNTLTDEHRKNWRCQECKNKVPKCDNTNTPVKQDDANITLRKRPDTKYPPPPPSTPPLNPVQMEVDTVAPRSMAYDEMLTELRLFREEMRSALLDIRGEVSKLASAVDHCNSRIDKLESRMEAVEQRPAQAPNSQILALEQTIADLKLDLNDRDQEMLLNDIEIAGIPEENNERSAHLVLMLAKKLGVALDERDLVSAERAGPVRRPAESETAPRPRPIVARLGRRALRDQLLAAARVRRGMTSEGLGVSDAARPVFINERLTASNRLLFYKARSESTRAQWKYVWTRGGKIFARKEHGSPRQRIHSEADINNVFGH